VDVDPLAVLLAELGLPPGALLGVVDTFESVAVDGVDRGLGTHDGDLAGGEGERGLGS